MRDADANLESPLRPVEIVGSLESINKAEKLIKDVIAEAEAGGSPALIARGVAIAPVTGSTEQIEIKVPNDKVVLSVIICCFFINKMEYFIESFEFRWV